MHDRQRLLGRAFDGEAVVGDAKQHFDDLKVGIGDAARDIDRRVAVVVVDRQRVRRHAETGDMRIGQHAGERRLRGIAEHDELVDIGAVINLDLADHFRIKLVRQGHRRRQRTVFRSHAAVDEQRAADAGQVVRLLREHAHAVRRRRAGLVEHQADRHRLIPVGGVEGDEVAVAVLLHARRLGQVDLGLAVDGDAYGDRRGRLRGQHDLVAVGLAGLRNGGVAVGLDDLHRGRIGIDDLDTDLLAVHAGKDAVRRIGRSHRVGDVNDLAVLGRAVGRRSYPDRLRVVPGKDVVDEIGNQPELDGRRKHADLPAVGGQRDGDRLAGCRRLVQHHRIGVAGRVTLEHAGRTAAFGDDDIRLVIVDDGDEHVRNLEVVERRRGAVGIAVDHRMADGDDSLAFLRIVGDRLDVDALAGAPVAVGEGDGDGFGEMDAVERDEDGLALPRPLLGRSLRGRDRDIGDGAGNRRHRQGQHVAVHRGGIVFLHRQPVADIDRDRRAAFGGQIDARREQAVVARIGARHGVGDGAAVAIGVVGDDGHHHIARNIERIAAKATDQRGDEIVGRGQHIEGVVAFEAVDIECFGIADPDRQPGAVDAVPGDDEGVGKLCAQHHHPVEAGAAVDVDGSVDVVLDDVVAVSAIDLDIDAVGQREGADDEFVVAVLALQPEIGMVGIDDEHVLAFAAVEHGRNGDALRQIAERGLDRLEAVFFREDGIRAVIGVELAVGIDLLVTRTAEDLADLEEVVAKAAVDREDRRIVVEIEAVVAVVALDLDTAVGGGVVVDALDRRQVAAGPVRHQVGDEVLAEQEGVGHFRAFDGQRVDAVVARAAVMDVHDVVAGAGDIDHDPVGAALAIDGQFVANDAPGSVAVEGRQAVDAGRHVLALIGGHRRQLVDGDEVVALPAMDERVSAQRHHVDQDGVVVAAARNVDLRRLKRAVEFDGRADVRIGIGHTALIIADDHYSGGRDDGRRGVHIDIVAGQKAHFAFRRLERHAGRDGDVVGQVVVADMRAFLIVFGPEFEFRPLGDAAFGDDDRARRHDIGAAAGVDAVGFGPDAADL